MTRRSIPIVLAAALALLVAVPSYALPAEQDSSGRMQRFAVSVDNVSNLAFHDSGVFNTPVGAGGPGPALPGAAYEWTFHAMPGDNLSFATMLVQSNDWFFAPAEPGIPLYSNGSQMTGDVTKYVLLWDAGTEGDEAPGEGPNRHRGNRDRTPDQPILRPSCVRS